MRLARWLATALVAVAAPAAGEPPRRGPWDHDVLVQRVGADGAVERLGAFPRAGVPTLVRLKDGRLVAAHQHFPADDAANFDKVAVRFSADEGATWTEPRVIGVQGLPEGSRFPFDPTLVPLPDGRVRLYFTWMRGKNPVEIPPVIGSAISSDALDYVVEPGARFAVEGRPVIDCAVVLHAGAFHLYAPDSGRGGPPPAGAAAPRAADRPRPGAGYHAVSRDGLAFERVEDVAIDGGGRWLGCAQSEADSILFFGTGDGGLWWAASADGSQWGVPFPLRGVEGADPGVVRLRGGGWLFVATGPPRR